MNTQKILTAVLIAVILYGAYSWWTTRSSEGYIDINANQYTPLTPKMPMVEAPVDRVVSSGGPATPNTAPPANMESMIMPQEEPYDPMMQGHESAEIPQRLRHPERMFGPGVVNDETGIAVAAGVASQSQQVTEQAYQIFGPEMAQNGGTFLDGGIMANDSSVPSEFSSV